MTILNVNIGIIENNLKYVSFMAIGMAGAFFFDHLANEIITISWECGLCSYIVSLMFAIAAGYFAFKFIRNHRELKVLFKENTS